MGHWSLVIDWSFGFGHSGFHTRGVLMSGPVRVDAIDSLKHFRIALLKFAEAADKAMCDVEADLQHQVNWLENEQATFWQGQIRKRAEILSRAREAMRMKQAFKDSSGRTPSAVDEEKAVRIAQARLEEAEQKLVNVKKYTRVLQREAQTYKGTVQRFMTTLQSDIPAAAAVLDGMVMSLEAYVSLTPADADVSAPLASDEPPPPPTDVPDGNSKPETGN
jgi:hypothetical protein